MLYKHTQRNAVYVGYIFQCGQEKFLFKDKLISVRTKGTNLIGDDYK